MIKATSKSALATILQHDIKPVLFSSFTRFQSTTVSASTATTPELPINHNTIYVIALPITTHKSYIYCNHRPSILDKSQLKTYPLITKLETKFTGLALKGWNTLKNSNNSINVKITKLVTSLLNTIPYEENCLTSFPSKNSMIREINEEAVNSLGEKNKTKLGTLVQSKIQDLNIPSNQIKPIPIYYPNFQEPSTILNQLNLFKDNSYSKHLKYSILCAIGVPISLPLAIVPVVPNVPGLYLTYRLYCNIKLLLGAKHLSYLLESNEKEVSSNETKTDPDYDPTKERSIQDTKHLSFIANDALDKIYNSENTILEMKQNGEDATDFDEEKVIINSKIIERLVNELDFGMLKDDLHKALRQETHRLEKTLKVHDAVE